jgi:transcriptional regulator with XRE-family HTH domain
MPTFIPPTPFRALTREELAQAQAAAGWTQEQCARALHIRRHAYARYLSQTGEARAISPAHSELLLIKMGFMNPITP